MLGSFSDGETLGPQRMDLGRGVGQESFKPILDLNLSCLFGMQVEISIQ